MSIRRFGGLVISCLVIGASTLLAHHSFAVFDMTQEKTITGVVSKFEWTNPHTFIFVDVPNDKGVVESWAIEGMSPNFLGRRGWSNTWRKRSEFGEGASSATVERRRRNRSAPGNRSCSSELREW